MPVKGERGRAALVNLENELPWVPTILIFGFFWQSRKKPDKFLDLVLMFRICEDLQLALPIFDPVENGFSKGIWGWFPTDQVGHYRGGTGNRNFSCLPLVGRVRSFPGHGF